MNISIVIPAYNEEKGIQVVLTKLKSLSFSNNIKKVEIIVVDNNSTDSTPRIARRLGANVVKETIQGYGSAYKKGINSATGDIIVTLDADDTYPVLQIPDLVDFFINNSIDFLIASRFMKNKEFSMPILNRIGNVLLTVIFNLLYSIKITDSQSGMWVFKKEIWNNMQIKSNSMAFSEEIKIEALYYLKLNFMEYGIPYYKRIGKVKLKIISDGVSNFIFLIKKKVKR